MNPRSRTFRRLGAGALLALLTLGVGCAPPDGADLDAADKEALAQGQPSPKAGCEDATPALLNTNENMLPGRDCGGCHRAGGQASNSPFTISGTVFTAANSPCNAGGVAGVYVEVLDNTGAIQPNGLIRTNGVGNFFSAFRYTTPLTVRVRQYGPDGPQLGVDMNGKSVANGMVVKEQVMMTPQGQDSGSGRVPVNCATCHQFPGRLAAPGRIFL